MIVSLRGMGWVTPLGRGLDPVWRKIQAGLRPAATPLENPFRKKTVPIARIPAADVRDAAALPRLRRSSAISHLAVAAALDAVADAKLTPAQLARTALIFAASDGGVIYTRRFYADIVDRGPGAGSPLLFPETVYNAPASHVAAALDLRGEALTLVGDATVAQAALQSAWEMLACGDADHCLVATAQEIDWITGEAYTRWGLVPEDPASPRPLFSEGAAALILSRQPGTCVLAALQPAPANALNLVNRLREFGDGLLIVSEAMGNTEITRLAKTFPPSVSLHPKLFLGEALGCSTMQQIIAAALALGASRAPAALCLTAGFHGRIAGLILTPNSKHDD